MVLTTEDGNKDEYEKTFGEVMDWRELPDNRACRIVATCNESFDLAVVETWENSILWMADKTKRLYDVLNKPIEIAVKNAKGKNLAAISEEA
jgi:hypothetical protein